MDIDIKKLVKALQYDTKMVGLLLVVLELSGEPELEIPDLGNVGVEVRHYRKQIKESLGMTEEVTTRL